MKNPWLIILLIVVVLAVHIIGASIFMSIALDRSWHSNSPDEQPMSCWSDENNRIEIHVVKPFVTVGTIQTDDGPIDVVLNISVLNGNITVYPIDSLDKYGNIDDSLYPPLEVWDTRFRWHDDRFKVAVYKSTYFTPGDTFTIYRTKEGVPPDEYDEIAEAHAWYAHSPSEQPFTRWTDEGGRIELRVDDTCATVGTIQTDDGPVEVVWNIFIRDGDITLYPIESLGEDGKIDRDLYPPLEKWDTCFQWFDDHFEVTVAQSTYFTPGETFTIYRAEEGVPLNEHSP